MNQDPIVQEILSFVVGYQRTYSDWYIGIAADPRSRLFKDHAVDEKGGPWFFSQAIEENRARKIEGYLLRTLGFDGGTGGGDSGFLSVYVYLKTQATTQ